MTVGDRWVSNPLATIDCGLVMSVLVYGQSMLASLWRERLDPSLREVGSKATSPPISISLPRMGLLLASQEFPVCPDLGFSTS